VIRGIVLPAGRSRVAIDADAGAIENAWIDLDYTLTNAATQRSVRSYTTVEHYSGNDSNGAWSHGDPRSEVELSSMPAGRYDLSVTVFAHRWNRRGGGAVPTTDSDRASFASQSRDAASASGATNGGAADATQPVTLTVKRGGAFGGVTFLAFLMITAWPVILVFKHFGFEKRRKAPGNSD
jgi:hypothetical protein